MKKSPKSKYKKHIQQLFKELIKRYKSDGYKEKIVPKSSEDTFPTFQLRFIKQGNNCVYYRIVLRDN
jgi:hypothetical protein